MKAFESFQTMDNLNTIQDKHRAWLKDYEGLYFSIGEKGDDKIFWQTEKEKYIYSDKRFGEPILCFDGTYRAEPNKIQRHPKRLIVEFDTDEKLNETREKAQARLLETKEYLKQLGYGLIQSNHNSTNGSDYLQIEFTREISDEEAKIFLKFLLRKFGGKIDLNFSSSKKRFPVLFATHWKYPKVRELPVEFVLGRQIDFDSFGLSDVKVQTQIIKKNGFAYETAVNKTEIGELGFWTIRDYDNYKPNEKFIIEDRAYPGEIEMVFGQSGSFKSMEMLYRAVCIAHGGRKYLGKFRIRKKAVGILSAENSKTTDKERIKKIMRGLRVRKKDIPLYILPRDYCGDILNPDFKTRLFDFVDKKKIEVLFMDSINPLTPEIDDNKAKDVTRVFNEILKDLSDKGIYISFLHHTDKQGRLFLGSMKWKANCDTVFRIERNGLDNRIQLYCEKSRDGEANYLEIAIDFLEKEIRFNLLKESEPELFKRKGKKSKIDIQKDSILMNLSKPISRKDLIDILKKKSQLTSLATFGRAISDLIGLKIKSENEVYSKI